MKRVKEPFEIEVRREFDAREARRIANALADVRADAAVDVDFRNVSAFDDRALSVLVAGLVGCRGNVSVLGLDRYHERLLRYLGVRVPPEAHERDG